MSCKHVRIVHNPVLPPAMAACARCGRIVDLRADLAELAKRTDRVGEFARLGLGVAARLWIEHAAEIRPG